MVDNVVKKMSNQELRDFVNRFTRCEMYVSRETVKSASKAVRVTLINLGYNVDWVETIFRDKIEKELERERKREFKKYIESLRIENKYGRNFE